MKEFTLKKKTEKLDSRTFSNITRTVHNPEPDYERPLLNIPEEVSERMFQHLCCLYGDALAKDYMPELERILTVYYAHKPRKMIEKEKHLGPEERFTEKDLILITYGDLIRGEEHSPLATLAKLADIHLRAINTLHILPFFPSSSDKGFSITDFETVDPNMGSWEDIEELDSRYQLMFDGVFNHVSSKSRWFQEFLNGNRYYKNFFIAYDSEDALTEEQRKRITRPRTGDVLTQFQTINGPVYVWSTFSPDQIDINFKNPDVLMRVIEVLLLYVRRGANLLRLDAVTYLWAEPGTPCASLEETHQIGKLFRDILGLVAQGTALVTETNVPHKENVSYFGNGHDEAHMVYNFALPPLVLYTFYTQNTLALSRWVKNLRKPSNTTHFFNFLDSHDGIGLMGAMGILSQEEIDSIIQRAKEHGGYVSYKTGRDGSELPYEINTTGFSALNKEDGEEDLGLQVKRLIASRTITLVLQGVPGIYLHGLIGTRNDVKAVLASESKRAINRTVLDSKAIAEAMKDPDSMFSRINASRSYYRIRTEHRAFHPNGAQEILMLSTDIFTVWRTSPEGDDHILALINVTDKVCHIEIPLVDVGMKETHWHDLISETDWIVRDEKLTIMFEPYDVIWLKPLSELNESTKENL